MSLLNYTHLRAFRAVAAEGNLTRAAEKLGVAQSAVSTQIKALEARLGHALFERRGRTMALTEAGRIAYDCAERAFAAGDELVETLAGRSGAQAVLRVGALATLSRNFQLNLLRPLVQDPEVSVVLRSGSIGELLAELEALRLDVVLTNAPPRHDAATPWREHRIDDQPVGLVGHAHRIPKDADLAALISAAPLVLPAEGSALRADFDRLMAREGLSPRIAAEADDMAMLRLLVREDAGLGLVPPIVVQDELESGLLIEALPLPDLHEAFWAITLPRRFPNPALARVLSME
ncbi:LysR family transcriptional regulator [Roseibacterium sp. SDUM158016]|uniref:LysR family transcriptional regulator n=1 Tax=Roseicyclus sediminis TaxID=2980997 RepID=UPI0021D3600C|nr:LysR family transcriptional regulator [Roseibacterium sp. SDUM158016]MCU4653939.1 LysR family transcriptional regulator [Roseibacterium sp. SDUM158016]